MSTTTDSFVTALPGLSQLTRGYESLMKGMMSVVLKQMELGGDLLEGSMADLSLLTQAQSPDKFIEAELEVFRRQSERAIAAAQKFSEEVNRSWSEASESLKTVN
jgi:hypothetical protein